MKTTNRVRNNPAVKRLSSQAQIKADLALPKGDCHPTCFCLYDRQTGEAFQKIPISEEEFIKLWELSFANNGAGVLANFIAAALRQRINAEKAGSEALDFLAFSRESLDTLFDLIINKFNFLTDYLTEFDTVTKESINAMIVLISAAQSQLQDACADVHSNFSPKGLAAVRAASK